jgi:hypothetical protein
MLRGVESVHVFSSVGRFASEGDLRQFVDMTYTADGGPVSSPFVREIHLRSYEPMCIECFHSDAEVPIRDLLTPASYGDQWLEHLRPDRQADTGICVFSPNLVRNPRGSSLEYCGAFVYTT